MSHPQFFFLLNDSTYCTSCYKPDNFCCFRYMQCSVPGIPALSTGSKHPDAIPALSYWVQVECSQFGNQVVCIGAWDVLPLSKCICHLQSTTVVQEK